MTFEQERQKQITTWWASRRKKYNIGLILAGVIAFLLYATAGITLIAPYDEEFEVTLFTTFFQGIGYLIMMAVANIFYGLGPYIDRKFNTKNEQRFRSRLYNLGFWGSFALPFTIPVLTVVSYFIEFA